MTHPAFLAFDTSGFWVGKFETGYEGAIVTTTTEMDTYDSSKIIIKPNVYSWRYNSLGNMFKASYDYLRQDQSHMMKNTEWGAVAYLQHSNYGSATSVRVNNNKDCITGYAAINEPINEESFTSIEGNRNESTQPGKDGVYTANYLNSVSVVASTTGNITGIYDMSGGAYEYVAGYTTRASTVGGESGIDSIYSDFFTNSVWNKYYDKYTTTSTEHRGFNNRILGDATGEMGPFYWQTSSWYNDYSVFITITHPWLRRGGIRYGGTTAGIFTFRSNRGGDRDDANSFRIVLAPTK